VTTATPTVSLFARLRSAGARRRRRRAARRPGRRLLTTLLCVLVVFAQRPSLATWMQTVGKDAAPEHHRRPADQDDLAAMHCHARLLLRDKLGFRDDERRRLEETEPVREAASGGHRRTARRRPHITYEEEKEPIRILLDDLGRYEA